MKQILKETICLSIFALLVISTNSSFSTLITYIHKQVQQHAERGGIILMVSSFAFLISNFLSPFLTAHPKQLLELSTVGMMINFIINFVFTGTKIEYPFLVIGAIVGGFSGGIFGVSLNSYMNILIEIHQKKSSSGFYFGIQGMITNGCLLVGGTFSLITGGASAQNFYYIYLFILLVSAWSFARFFLNDRAIIISQQASWLKPNFSIGNMLKDTARTYRKLYPLLFIQIIYGFMNGLLSQCVIDLVPQDYANTKGRMLAKAIMVIGVGAMVGSYFTGKLSDLVSIKKVGVTLLAIYMFLIGTIWLGIKNPNLFLFYLSSFLIGVSLLGLFSWLLICCSKIYSGSVSVFSVNRQICTLSFLIYQGIAVSVFEAETMPTIMKFQLGLFALFGFSALVMLRFLPNPPRIQQQASQPNIKTLQLSQDMPNFKEKASESVNKNMIDIDEEPGKIDLIEQ